MGQLQVLGDISAISGARLEDLVRIFGKVNATGRTSLENINEIATRNIPIYDTLIRQLGSTRDGLRTLASTGQITAADFNRALQSMTEEGGIFFEGMIKQSQTLAGQWSTLKDNVAQLAEALGKLLVPVLKDVVRITTEMIQAYQLFFSVAQAITGRKLVRLPEVQTGANRDAKLGAITRDTTQKNIAAAKLYAKTMAAEIKARLSHSISSAMKEADRLRVQLDIKPMLIGAIERGSTAALQQLERVRQQSRLDRIAETHRQRLRELNERILTEQREANAHLKAIEEAASKGIKLGVATI
jgi:tape measure domain-containing protein